MDLLKRQVPGNPLEFIRACVLSGRIRWTYHVSMRLRQRSLSGEMLVKGVGSLEIIEAYPDDKYLPSFLLRGECEGDVFHSQIAADVEADNVRVVTMYVPSAGEWDAELRVRRKQQ